MIRRNSINKMQTVTIVLFIFGITIFPIINAYPIDKNENIQYFDEGNVGATMASHHKVIAEVGTATWCPYCPAMAYWIDKVSGDFQFISLVSDKSGAASSRCGELGISGIPDAVFDGGYTHVLGGQSSVNNLQNAYNQCQSRTVANVDISLFGIWNEGTIKIIAYVDNSGSSTYNGHLHIYVTEKISRWLDYNGDPYKYAMLGYAFNGNIVVEPGSTWIGTVNSWSFPEITMDNILIVATVFGQSPNYADETATTEPVEDGGGGGGGGVLPPLSKVQITSPGDGQIISDTVSITGNAHHAQGDGLIKWVLIKIGDNDWELADGTVIWSYEWDSTTVEDGEILIQAVATDGNTQSGVDYTNCLVNNHGNLAPYAPVTPSGPSSVFAGYSYIYSTNTTDPTDDDIRYGWDFTGDGNIDYWTEFYSSGTTVETEYSWGESGTYYVKVIAEDIYGEQSIFSTDFPVTVTGTNEPPSTPIINGPTTILPEEEQAYKVSSADFEGGDVYYLIQWEEGVSQGWFGPYDSGDEITFTHSWRDKGNYEIKIKAKDIHNVESDWGILEITVPKSRFFMNNILYQNLKTFINRFSFFEKILDQII